MFTKFFPKWPSSYSVCPISVSTSAMVPSPKRCFRRVVFVKRDATTTVEVGDLPRTDRLHYKPIFDLKKKVDVRRGMRGKGLFAKETIGRDDGIMEFKGERISSEEAEVRQR